MESIKQTCGKYGIQVHFKGDTTITKVLMKHKDQDPKDSKSGIIYSYQYKYLDCDKEYIGETARTLQERRKECLKQLSPIHGHSQAAGQQQFQYLRKGGLGAGQDHQGIHIYEGKQSYFKPEYW